MSSGSGSLSRYILVRILLIIPMLWVVLTMVFFMLRVAPGDPVSAAFGGRLSEEALDVRREALGLDRPLIVQYLEYLGQVARVQLRHHRLRQPPGHRRDPRPGRRDADPDGRARSSSPWRSVSRWGGWRAATATRAADAGIRIFGVVTYAAPIFWVGIMLVLLVVELFPGWPTSGIATPITIFTIQPQTHILLVDSILAGDSTATTDVLKHHVLPCFTLGLLLCGVIIRLVRVNVIQAMKGDYVEAARARGISERNVVRRHAFRNALVPVITVIGLLVALTLGGRRAHGTDLQLARHRQRADPVPQRPRLHRRAGPGHVLRRGGGGVQPGGGHHQRARRPEGAVLTCAKLIKQIWNTKGLARWIFLVGLVVTILFVVAAIFAPWIAPFDYNQTRDAAGVKFPKLAPPGGDHWLGTNDQFYDIWSRVVWGARTAVEVVVLSVVFSALIGVPLGMVSGFVGGSVDRVLVFLMDALYAFPSLLLAIVFSFLLTGLLGGGVVAVALSLTTIYVPQYYRVVRSTTVSTRETTYVEAARAIGAKPMHDHAQVRLRQRGPVGARHRHPQRRRRLSTLAALGFLGWGIQPNEASEWGYDLSRALDDAQAGVWWPALWPGLAIITLITALTLVGEGLNETVNPALRRRRLQGVTFGHVPTEAEREAAVR